MSVPFHVWIGAAVVLTFGVGLLSAWDERAAWVLVILILLAVFLRYPSATTQIAQMFGIHTPTQSPGGGLVH